MNDRASRNELPPSVLAEPGDFLGSIRHERRVPRHRPLIDYCKAD
ncbi:hypothetical protein [Massilia sp. YIM B04103]|nr:hypothetical protein [Massilia sp. YIM B04103]